MQVVATLLTDPGRRRGHNEDYVASWEPADTAELEVSGSLYLVADGVGGARAGEVASRYAAEAILHEYYRSVEPDLGVRLVAAIKKANAEISAYNMQQEPQRPVGTTVVAAVIHGSDLLVGNVGDSRAYIVHEGEEEQITLDHNIVAEMLRRGDLTEVEAKDNPLRSRLTRCLGIEPAVTVDLFRRTLRENDIVVLCSDGLTRHVMPAEIAQIVTRESSQKAARQLVNLANQRGGEDNISVVVIKCAPTTPRRRFGLKLGGRGQPGPPQWKT